tara:strand:- start:242 stop:499 length:258 start_codon:yes stop_codon:yes gene_type:complete
VNDARFPPIPVAPNIQSINPTRASFPLDVVVPEGVVVDESPPSSSSPLGRTCPITAPTRLDAAALDMAVVRAPIAFVSDVRVTFE